MPQENNGHCAECGEWHKKVAPGQEPGDNCRFLDAHDGTAIAFQSRPVWPVPDSNPNGTALAVA